MKFIWIVILLFNLTAYSQDSAEVQYRIKVEVMQNEIDNLKGQIEDNKLHAKELQDAQKDEVNRIMQEKEAALDSRMLIYVSFFIAAFVIVFGFFRWLGKGEMRKIINDQATKEIDGQLKVKLSNSVIDDKLTSLGKPIIEEMLNDITKSNEKAKVNASELEKSNKLYKKLLEELSVKHAGTDPFKPSIEEKEKTEEFTQILDKIKGEDEYTAQDWYMKGLEAYRKNELQQAIDHFSKCLSLNPTNDQKQYSLFYRGLAKYTLSDYKGALDDFTQALTVDDKGFLYFIRSSAYEFMGSLPEALKDIEKAIELEPDDQQYKTNRANVLKKMELKN
jgi:tetratricopeptide (TPR) repeat protein